MRFMIILAICLWPLPALAQISCLPREIAMKRIEGFKEEKIGIGLMGNTFLFELWRNPKTGSWTITRVGTNGVTCFIGGGSGWAQLIQPPGEPV